MVFESEKHIDLGTWLGRQHAFAIIAGTSSAARAQCLKQVRESKLLDDLGLTWEEFCKDYAGLSRQHAENLIQQYEQFGDAYFRLSEIARVSPQTYQKLAPKLDGDAIVIDGVKLALKPENAHKIRAAIQALRNQAKRAPAARRPPAGVVELQVRIDAVADDLAGAVRAVTPGDSDELLRTLASHAVNRFVTISRQFADRDPLPE